VGNIGLQVGAYMVLAVEVGQWGAIEGAFSVYQSSVVCDSDAAEYSSL
jgi:hypothetical protein